VAKQHHGVRGWVAGRLTWKLGTLHLQRREFKTAEPLLRWARARAEETFGKDSVHTVAVLIDHCMALSLVEDHSGLLEAAVALQVRSAKSPKLRDSGLVLGLRWQAGALSRLERYEEAEAVYRRLFAEATTRNRERDVATAHAGLGFVLRHRGELAEAETHYRAALRMRSKHHGPNDRRVAGGWIGLGRIRLAQKRYDEAEDYVRKGLAIREKDERRNPSKFIETLETLAEIVEARGRQAEAEKIRARIAGLKEKPSR
jgi:tetratricopeptide (TPR) repeat protein